MSDDNIIDLASQSADFDPLNDLLQQGARRLIAQAVEAELVRLSNFVILRFNNRKISGFSTLWQLVRT